jgi:TATA-binding protein-associated factor Taf7
MSKDLVPDDSVFTWNDEEDTVKEVDVGSQSFGEHEEEEEEGERSHTSYGSSEEESEEEEEGEEEEEEEEEEVDEEDLDYLREALGEEVEVVVEEQLTQAVRNLFLNFKVSNPATRTKYIEQIANYVQIFLDETFICSKDS